jgi:AcrR family transcriptional regulator
MPQSTKPDGRSARWETHRAERRQELVKAAMAAVEKHGAAVGMDQIAAEAGTSKAVFYRHFNDKNDLYRAVGQYMIEVLQRRVASKVGRESTNDARAMLAAGIDSFLAVLERTPEVYRFVVHNPVVKQAGANGLVDYTGSMAQLVELLIEQYFPNSSPHPSGPLASAVVGYVKAGGEWWLNNPNVMTRAELTASLTDLLWNGVQRFQAEGARE